MEESIMTLLNPDNLNLAYNLENFVETKLEDARKCSYLIVTLNKLQFGLVGGKFQGYIGGMYIG